MFYTVTKASDGTVIACGAFSAPPSKLATGQLVCDQADYDAARATLLSPTLAQRAAAALSAAQATVWSSYGALGESVPADWVTYQRALLAIVNGADTTSAALPATPSL